MAIDMNRPIPTHMTRPESRPAPLLPLDPGGAAHQVASYKLTPSAPPHPTTRGHYQGQGRVRGQLQRRGKL